MDSYSFTIPSLPASMNTINNIIWRGHIEVVLKPEVRQWKSQAKLFVPPIKVKNGDRFYIGLTFVFNGLYKNGRPKRIDLDNLLKVTKDVICEKIGIDDTAWRIPHIELKHIQDTDKREVRCVLKRLNLE